MLRLLGCLGGAARGREDNDARTCARGLGSSAERLTAFLTDYGRSGFQPSGISFPTEGCWEVTGAVGDAKLTFVTLILKASRYSLVAEDG